MLDRDVAAAPERPAAPRAGIPYMSGYTGEHLSPFGALPPEADLLPKPFTGEALLVRIREVLELRARPPLVAGA